MARRLGVSREDVVAAAVDVCDRAGLDGLTVAAVAERVGCRPPSVYHHVDGLDGLSRSVALVAAQHLASSLEVAERGREGLDALRSMSRIARSWARSHPGRFAAVCRPVDHDTDPELAAARQRLLAPVRRALRSAGVPEDDTEAWTTALVAAVRGSAAVELDGEPGSPDDRAAGHELLVGLLLDHIQRQDATAATA